MIYRNINERFGDPVVFSSLDEMASAIRNSGYDLPDDDLKEGRDFESLETITLYRSTKFAEPGRWEKSWSMTPYNGGYDGIEEETFALPNGVHLGVDAMGEKHLYQGDDVLEIITSEDGTPILYGMHTGEEGLILSSLPILQGNTAAEEEYMADEEEDKAMFPSL